MGYQNFDLTFERGQGGFRVAATSPEGQASLLDFRVPASLLEAIPEGRARQQEVGEELYAALFRGELRDLWERCSGRGASGAPRRRRLRLHLDPDRELHRVLAGLPWELIHDGRRFVSLQRGTTLVRFIDEAVAMEPVAFEPPLRLLVARPAPRGATEVGGGEVEKVGTNWTRHGGVQVIPVDPPAAHLLRSQLIEHGAHALHFIGHGDFDPKTGEGFLLFEGRGRTGVKQTGEMLAALASDLPSLRLVVLNACHTARHHTGRTAAAFSGVAAALSRGGVAAVVAMQLEVHDGLAAVFADTLHRHLAAGDSVEEAVVEGRIAVHAEAPDGLDWLAPVLFLRAEDGRLFVPTGHGKREEIGRGDRPRDEVEISEIEVEGDNVTVTGRKGPAPDGPRATRIEKSRFRGSGIVITGEDRT